MTSLSLVLGLLFISTQAHGDIFIKEPKDQIVPLKSKAAISFSCEASLTNVVYSWRKDNVAIDPKVDSRFGLYGGDLEITSPKSSDAGAYQCVASGDEGIAASNYGNLKFAYINDFQDTTSDPVSANEGEGVSIPCSGASYAPEHTVLFYWESTNKFENIKPPFNKTHYVSQKTGTLYIATARPSDTDVLVCIIRSIWTVGSVPVSKRSSGVKLSVTPNPQAESAPTFLLRPSNISATLGGKILLECYASGSPTPDITWRKRSGELPVNSTITSARQLVLINITEEMMGEYICTASNSLGYAMASAFVHLQYKPRWTEALSSKSADLTTDFTLRCGATAAPAPTFAWLKNAQVLESTDRIMITQSDQESSLMIEDAVEEDEAMYQCVATNLLGSIFSSSKLTINYYKPEFLTNVPGLTKAAEGKEVKILCVVTSAPPATITWSKDDQPITMNNQKFSLENTGSLLIKNATKLDEGKYTCNANNSLGYISGEGHLKVYESTKITKQPEDISAMVGSDLQLSCDAAYDHDLNLEWKWLQDDVAVISRDHYQPSGSSLLLSDVTSKQSGVYKCCAESPIESICASATVVVTAPPDAPMDVTVTSSTATTQTLKWSIPKANEDEITHYIVEEKNILEAEWFSATTAKNVTNNRCQVTGLLPYNHYVYRVSAVNSLGSGEASKESSPGLTLAAAPSHSPSGLRTGKSVLGQLVVQWDKFSPTLYASAHVSYVVAVRKEDIGTPVHPIIDLNNTMPDLTEENGGPWTEKVISNSEAIQTSFTVDTSEIFVPYQAKIRADNSQGNGPFSDVTIVRTAEIAPTTAPSGFLKEGGLAYSLDIAWLRLYDKTGFTKGYNVSLCDVTKDETCTNNQLLINATTKDATPKIHIEGLEANKLYKVSASAWNTGGDGPFSAWSTEYMFETEKPPPNEAPQNVKITFLDLTLTATWDPLQWDEQISGYKVQYWKNNETSVDAENFATTKTQATFDLPDKSEYNVRVVAYNAGGNGRPSVTFAVSTQKGSTEKYVGGNASSITASFTLVMYIATLWSTVHLLM